MKTSTVLFLFAIALLLDGCQSAPPPSPAAKFIGLPAKSLTVTVTCSDPRTRFMGCIETDGEADHLVGMSSGTYQTSGHEISIDFKKTDKPGILKLSVSSDGKSLGNCSTAESLGGVRAEFFFVPPKEHTLFTTF
jgi:hypothetical protein